MLICWDLAFPEAFRELICQGAKLIIIPSFWTLNDCSEEGLKYNPSAEVVLLDSFLTARTFENTCGESVSKDTNESNKLINVSNCLRKCRWSSGLWICRSFTSHCSFHRTDHKAWRFK